MSLLTLLIVFLHSSRLCEPVGTLSIALRLASGSEDNTVRLWDRAYSNAASRQLGVLGNVAENFHQSYLIGLG